MQSGLLFVLSWLGFSVLFYSMYLLIQAEYLFGALLGLLSLLAIYFSMKLSNDKTPRKKTDIDEPIIIPKKKMNEDQVEDHLVTVIEEKVVKVEESPWDIQFSNKSLQGALNNLVDEMIIERMCLENDDFYANEEVIAEKYLINEEIYQFQFHPVPLVAIIYNKDIDEFQIMMGLTRSSMNHIAIVPQEYKEAIQSIYQKLYDVKAYIEKGPYRIVDEDLENWVDKENDFYLRLRFYYK